MAFSKRKKLVFTLHAQSKMRFYGFSEARIRRVIHSPLRVEEGIAEGTVAMMQALGNGAHEIWVMFADEPSERRIISAWRYPGRTKPGEPLPVEILAELRASLI